MNIVLILNDVFYAFFSKFLYLECVEYILDIRINFNWQATDKSLI